MKQEVVKSFKEAEDYFKNNNNSQEIICLSHNNTFETVKSIEAAKKFYINNGEEPIECIEKLYVEYDEKSGHIFTPEEQEGGYIQISVCRPATESEVEKARKHFRDHRKCEYHLFYDKPAFLYDSRNCGICGRHIAMI